MTAATTDRVWSDNSVSHETPTVTSGTDPRRHRTGQRATWRDGTTTRHDVAATRDQYLEVLRQDNSPELLGADRTTIGLGMNRGEALAEGGI